MLSIWERNHLTHYDYIIIGGGIVGLSTAYYLKQKNPAVTVVILERGLLPSGASTKNAGFACMGSLTEILDDLTTSSEDEVLELFLLRKKGLDRLHSILPAEKTGYKTNGSYELIFESQKSCLEKMDYCNALLVKELKTNAFIINQNKLNEFGFKGVHTLIENTCEGEIDTGLMMKNFIVLVQSMGVDIKTGCEVVSLQENSQGVEVHCKNPVHEDPLIFKTNKVLVCNNAFARTLFSDLDVTPGRGQVIYTKPIPGLKFKGIFHFEQGYYYFREYKGGVLFGGGRHLDKPGETTTEFGIHSIIQNDLIQKLHTIILPNQDIEIDLQWSGIMAFGADKHPIVAQHSDRIYIGVRMGGMGVAIGSEVGYQLSQME